MGELEKQDSKGEQHGYYDQESLDSFDLLAKEYFGASSLKRVKFVGTYIVGADGNSCRIVHLRVLKNNTILPGEIYCKNGRHRWFQNVSETYEDTEGNYLEIGAIYKLGVSAIFLSPKGDLRIKVKNIKRMYNDIKPNYWKSDVKIVLLTKHQKIAKLQKDELHSRPEYAKLQTAFQNNTALSATIAERVKGGFKVLIEGIECFLPGSQTLIDITNYDPNGQVLIKCLLLRENDDGRWVVSEK